MVKITLEGVIEDICIDDVKTLHRGVLILLGKVIENLGNIEPSLNDYESTCKSIIERAVRTRKVGSFCNLVTLYNAGYKENICDQYTMPERLASLVNLFLPEKCAEYKQYIFPENFSSEAKNILDHVRNVRDTIIMEPKVKPLFDINIELERKYDFNDLWQKFSLAKSEKTRKRIGKLINKTANASTNFQIAYLQAEFDRKEEMIRVLQLYNNFYQRLSEHLKLKEQELSTYLGERKND